MTTLKQTLLNVVPKSLINLYIEFKLTVFDGYASKSYSQEGEDMILRRIFGNQSTGFYVDVGAHHPKRFSNTYYFYKRGWRGINIDAMPGSINEFNKQRRKDINLEIGIASQKGILTYYIFNEPALNTFDEELALHREKSKQYFIKSKIAIPVAPLEDVLKKHLSVSQTIDFMSVDVEGFDFQVLHSNNWQRYRPHYLLVECLELDGWDDSTDPIHDFLRAQNYRPISKTVNTLIYKDCRKRCLISNFILPVLFLIFNRPDTTALVFEAIRNAQPPQLYIAADGPRENKPGEIDRVEEARRIVLDNID